MLSGEQFTSEFSRPSLATSRYTLRRVPVDLFDIKRLGEQLDSIIADRPLMIIAPASRAAKLAKDRTRSIPILFVSLGDPVSLGLLSSAARPEGNVTGFTYRMYDYRKLFEVTAEAVGAKGTACLVVDRTWMSMPTYRDLTVDIEKSVGLRISVIAEDDSVEALRQAANLKVDAWIVPDTAMARRGGVEFGRKLRASGGIVVTEVESIFLGGAHMLVAPDVERPLRTLAEFGSQILKGVPISELPVTRPKRWTLEMNMTEINKTPSDHWKTLLRRADKFR